MFKSKSEKIYIVLIFILAILAAISIYLPQGNLVPDLELPAPKIVLSITNFLIMLFIYGGLGYIGIILSKKVGFPNLWEERFSIKQKIWIPTIIGILNGVLFILIDLIFSNFNTIGRLPHPVFPTSLVASITAGISEEVIFRLFFISFWMWLISKVIFKGKYRNIIFAFLVGISAVFFTFAHLPSIIFITEAKTIDDLPRVLIMQLFILNGSLTIFCAYYFKKYGILAAILIHFWADVMWHVIWGML